MSSYLRNLISERTKISLSILKSKGIKLGRPLKCKQDLILEYYEIGLSLRQISQETGLHYSTISKFLKRVK